jgi:hypothetical protein
MSRLSLVASSSPLCYLFLCPPRSTARLPPLFPRPSPVHARHSLTSTPLALFIMANFIPTSCLTGPAKPQPSPGQAILTQASPSTPHESASSPSQPDNGPHANDLQPASDESLLEDELTLEPTTDGSSAATVSTDADDTGRPTAFLRDHLELTTTNVDIFNRINGSPLELRLLYLSNTKTRSSLEVRRSTIYTCSEVDVAEGPEAWAPVEVNSTDSQYFGMGAWACVDRSVSKARGCKTI